MMRQLEQWTLILGFLGLLVTPAVITLVGDGAGASAKENRNLAKPPNFSLSKATLTSFPKETEAWFNDRFGMRDQLIAAHQSLEYRVFKKSPTEKVIIGDQGWLYLADTLNQHPDKLSPEFYDKAYDFIRQRQDWLAEQEIPYLFVLAADKEHIYPQYLGRRYRHQLGLSPNKVFMEQMASRGELSILDMAPVIRAADEGEPLYYKTDTHWNYLGGLKGYLAMAQWLEQNLAGFEADHFEGYTWPKATRDDGDLARILGFSGKISELTYQFPRTYRWCQFEEEKLPLYSDEPLIDSRKPKAWLCKDKPLTALVIHDSFASAFKIFLGQNFGRTVWIWDDLDFETFQQLVEQEQPDVVIEEHVARIHSLRKLVNY